MKNVHSQLQHHDLLLARLLTRLVQQWQGDTDTETLLMTTVTEVRSFLKADCVQIGQLSADGQGHVRVESRREQLLPSLLSIPGRGDGIPPQICDLLNSAFQASIIDVSTRRIRQSTRQVVGAEDQPEMLQVHPLESPHAAFFAEMGVRTALLVPLYNQAQAWGTIIVYHAAPFAFSQAELELVQLIAHQLLIAMSEGERAQQATTQSQPQGVMDQITQLLHLPERLDLQAALEAAVLTLGGSGGRLYLLDAEKNDAEKNASPQPLAQSTESKPRALAEAQLYIYGVQPATSAFTKYAAIEQYHVWQNHFQAHDDVIWAIPNLFEEPELQSLQSVFQPTPIRRLLMIPLWYRQQPLGYLSIFRDGVKLEPQAIAQPSQFFNESSRGQSNVHHQASPWTANEIEMGQTLGMHFAAAVQRSQGQMQLQTLTASLEHQVQQRTITLQQFAERQQVLLRVVSKIRQSLDIDTIFRTTTREICQIVQAERVAVYRFNEHWGGEFVNDFEFATNDWNGLSKLGVNLVWNDTYLQETQGGRYRFKETLVVDDVYAAALTPCHLEILEQYQVRAHVIAPIFLGQQLWGLLAVYQHSSPRLWQEEDVKFLNQVTEQLGVALQQANVVGHAQPKAEQATDPVLN